MLQLRGPVRRPTGGGCRRKGRASAGRPPLDPPSPAPIAPSWPRRRPPAARRADAEVLPGGPPRVAPSRSRRGRSSAPTARRWHESGRGPRGIGWSETSPCASLRLLSAATKFFPRFERQPPRPARPRFERRRLSSPSLEEPWNVGGRVGALLSTRNHSGHGCLGAAPLRYSSSARLLFYFSCVCFLFFYLFEVYSDAYTFPLSRSPPRSHAFLA